MTSGPDVQPLPDLATLAFSAARALENGSRSIDMQHGRKKKLVLNLPLLRAPFGIGTANGPAALRRRTLDLSLDDPSLASWFAGLDEKVAAMAAERAATWFERQDEQQAAEYVPSVRPSRDQRFPPLFRVTVPCKDGVALPPLTDASSGAPLSDIDRGAWVRATVICTGVWSSSVKYGCSWKLVKLAAEPRPATAGGAPRPPITGYRFMQDDS